MKKYILAKHFWGFIFLFIIFFSGINSAYAHKVMIFAWVDGDTVFTQSKFSGGKKVKGGKIAVYDTQEKILLEGKTDDKGEFSFKVPEKTTLKIVLYAGAGHRAEWTVPKEDIEEMSEEKPAKSTLKKPQVKMPTNTILSEPTENRTDEMPQAPQPPEPGTDEIEQAVEKALDKKLKPIIKMLNESLDSGPTVSEILGGIGYILGLMGVGAYFHYRRRKD
ncbi:MAG: hypothetical protein JRD05_13575 [Deltaproteobacteria bacterium]|nr:hypothetical protein [Deltaproteobacteria bacterium]